MGEMMQFDHSFSIGWLKLPYHDQKLACTKQSSHRNQKQQQLVLMDGFRLYWISIYIDTLCYVGHLVHHDFVQSQSMITWVSTMCSMNLFWLSMVLHQLTRHPWFLRTGDLFTAQPVNWWNRRGGSWHSLTWRCFPVDIGLNKVMDTRGQTAKQVA